MRRGGPGSLLPVGQPVRQWDRSTGYRRCGASTDLGEENRSGRRDRDRFAGVAAESASNRSAALSDQTFEIRRVIQADPFEKLAAVRCGDRFDNVPSVVVQPALNRYCGAAERLRFALNQ